MTNSTSNNYPESFPSTNLHPNENWFIDSDATHHMTLDLANDQNHSSYSGGEQIVVGHGKSIPITHVGSTSLSSQVPNHFVKLSYVLHAPTYLII